MKTKSKNVPLWALLVSVIVGLVAVVGVGYAAASARTPMAGDPGLCASSNVVFKDAPLPGWQYFALYNTTTGFINSVNAQPDCQIQPSLQRLGISASDQAAVDSKIIGTTPGISAVNVTSSAWLPHLSEYINAFYVVVSNGTIMVKPGVTFSGVTAYYNDELITNGTAIPLPSQ